MSATGNLGSFKNSFCMKYVVRPERFEREVFRRCLHERSQTLAKLILAVYPGFFRRDLMLIQEVARATSLEEVKESLHRYHKDNQAQRGFLRHRLKVRLSGERVLRLGAELFGRDGDGGSER
jgi:hypothetical protein